MGDTWNNCPAQPQALRRSIEEIDSNSELCLHEIENEVSYSESVALATHELKRLMKPRPLSEWTEEDGDVLWWRFPIEEPPYCGSPNDLGYTVELHTQDSQEPRIACRGSIGGWPGGYTHWTPIPQVREPAQTKPITAPGYPTRPEAVKAAMAFYAKGNGVLGVEGSDFRITQTGEGMWNFEAGLDGESN